MIIPSGFYFLWGFLATGPFIGLACFIARFWTGGSVVLSLWLGLVVCLLTGIGL